MRIALPLFTSMNVAATLPQSRNFSARFAEAASGDHGDRVGGATIDFNEGYEALPVFPLRIVNAKFLQAEHGETYAKNLARAEVAMSLFSVEEVFVEGFHESSSQLSAVSFQLNIPRARNSGSQRVHFLLQRMLSFVISTRMPASASSARIASDVLKSRALRAVFIASICFSMSASGSCPD